MSKFHLPLGFDYLGHVGLQGRGYQGEQAEENLRVVTKSGVECSWGSGTCQHSGPQASIPFCTMVSFCDWLLLLSDRCAFGPECCIVLHSTGVHRFPSSRAYTLGRLWLGFGSMPDPGSVSCTEGGALWSSALRCKGRKEQFSCEKGGMCPNKGAGGCQAVKVTDV